MSDGHHSIPELGINTTIWEEAVRPENELKLSRPWGSIARAQKLFRLT